MGIKMPCVSLLLTDQWDHTHNMLSQILIKIPSRI